MFGEVLFRIYRRRALLQSSLRLKKVTSGERGWRRIIVYAPPPSHFNIYDVDRLQRLYLFFFITFFLFYTKCNLEAVEANYCLCSIPFSF